LQEFGGAVTGSQQTGSVDDGARVAGLGERLRELRVAAGLTQTELAAGRFSKEYVSQIERGKTRPTRETLEWLARRLGVDAGFLDAGLPAVERGRLEAVLVRAEASSEAHRDEEAVAEFQRVRAAVRGTAAVDLEFRALVGEAWARTALGEVNEAIEILNEARGLAEGGEFTDVDRADVLFRLGAARYKVASMSTAIGLFGEALALAERSGLPCDQLRANIHHYRGRCYRHQRDWEAAREDVERALELSSHLDDPRFTADAFFQASLVAERQGSWVLARGYAERAKALFEEISDREAVGRLLNNLGGLNYLLGKPREAIEYLKDAFRVALEIDNKADAGMFVGSLAEVHFGTGEYVLAEQHARHALELLDGRLDYIRDIGTAQLTLGRALLEQDRLNEAEETLRAADNSFEQLSSASHRAAAWMAFGDLAVRRGDDREAARQYRRAAEALQDFRF
jgi:tetratricopeptide (TPR) repeat protein